MLGCVGVPPGDAPLSRLHSAYVSGNMDFSGIAEGTKVFLRVHPPGVLLYLGDEHALHGDKELSGDALETSMDIDVSADCPEKSAALRVLRTKDHLMEMGLSGTLDDAQRRNVHRFAFQRTSHSAGYFTNTLLLFTDI
jgi:amidase